MVDRVMTGFGAVREMTPGRVSTLESLRPSADSALRQLGVIENIDNLSLVDFIVKHEQVEEGRKVSSP